MIQTVSPYRIQKFDLRVKPLILKIWNKTNPVDITKTFQTIFSPHRFHGVCRVQFAYSYFDDAASATMSNWELGLEHVRIVLP